MGSKGIVAGPEGVYTAWQISGTPHGRNLFSSGHPPFKAKRREKGGAKSPLP